MSLFVLILGALRIMQTLCNKKTSVFLESKDIFFRYGMLFEFSSAIFGLVYLGFVGFYGLNLKTVIVSLITAISYVTELITALQALKGAPIVLCNMCSLGGGIILTSIAGIFFFDESMTVNRWLGVILFFFGAFCISAEKKGKKATEKITMKTLIILVLNFLINGIASILSKYFAVYVEGGNIAIYTVITYLFASLLFALLFFILRVRTLKSLSFPDKRQEEHLQPFPMKLFVYAGILGVTCSSIVYLSTFLAKTVSLVVLNTVPSAISIIGCLIVGALLYKEKITTRKCIGIISGILSALMIMS